MDLIAISPHESVPDRIDALRDCQNEATAQVLCRDEACPPRLRVEALVLLSNKTGGRDDESFLSILCCYVPIVEPENRHVAGKLIQNEFSRKDWMKVISDRFANHPERFLLLAIWGLCTYAAENKNEPTAEARKAQTVAVSFVDALAKIAGEDFLDDAITKSELMGSHRSEALAALCIRLIGVFVDVLWLKEALDSFQAVPLRTAAVNVIVKETRPLTNMDSMLFAVILCDALENSLQRDDLLRRWNDLWYYGASLDKDESANKVEARCRGFAAEVYPLMVLAHRWFKSLHAKDLDPAVASRIVFVFSGWATKNPKGGICFPWVAKECQEIARQILDHMVELLGKDSIVIDMGELRHRLARDAWKTDWTGCGALVFLASHADKYCTLLEPELHLLPALLPIADDIDPRIAGPAWSAIRESLHRISSNDSPILFRALERALATQDPEQYRRVTECARLALSRFDGETYLEHDRFLEKLCRDLYYSASSSPALYSIAVENVLCHLVRVSDVFVIRLLPMLLDAIQAGSQKRGTAQAALSLLDAVLSACAPRINAHRGEIFTVFMRLTVNIVHDQGKMKLATAFQEYRKALGRDHQEWIDKHIKNLEKVAPDFADKFVENKLDLVD